MISLTLAEIAAVTGGYSRERDHPPDEYGCKNRRLFTDGHRQAAEPRRKRSQSLIHCYLLLRR